MDVVAVGLVLTTVGLIGLLMWEVAPSWWRSPRSRGEVAEVPALDEGEAFCTDPPPADAVDEHAMHAIAALNPPVSDDGRDAALLALGDYVAEERRHFEQWESELLAGGDR